MVGYSATVPNKCLSFQPVGRMGRPFTVKADGQSMYLDALSLSAMMRADSSGSKKYTQEGAAELLWALLIERLQ